MLPNCRQARRGEQLLEAFGAISYWELKGTELSQRPWEREEAGNAERGAAQEQSEAFAWSECGRGERGPYRPGFVPRCLSAAVPFEAC